jgi:hypothetical protein
MLNLIHLDERTRRLMAEEVDHDLRHGTLHVSPRLSNTGQQNYVTLLKEAFRSFDAAWLADQLSRHNRMRRMEQKVNPHGGYLTARISRQAAEGLAEGEFNRFYMRALCLRAIEDDIPALVVYRARLAKQPRMTSEKKRGNLIDPRELLDDLRARPGERPEYGLPAGPNSGLSVRLPGQEDRGVKSWHDNANRGKKTTHRRS